MSPLVSAGGNVGTGSGQAGDDEIPPIGSCRRNKYLRCEPNAYPTATRDSEAGASGGFGRAASLTVPSMGNPVARACSRALQGGIPVP